ncbi:MAG: DnaJ domain-containing protein [Armatimonadota bacterium]|nr:MAG: DnaJ domain-containing protein [Armatimonadota bacterium]
MRLQFDSEVDYYEVLQVHPKAHPEIIKRAYRTLVAHLNAHPDLGGSHQQMVLINRAYEVLSNPELRGAYDDWRESRSAPQPRPATRPSPPPSPPRDRPTTAGTITAVCLKCGRRNRVPQDIGLARARCGACGERLIPTASAGRGETTRTHDAAAGSHRTAAHRLPQDLYNELCREGQLRVQLHRVARGSRLVCRRCQQPWWAPRSGKPPRRCPACGSDEWLTFRLFKCAECGREFETGNLRGWPYLLYPQCPECGSRHWSRAAERSPLRWLMRLLRRRG